MLEWLRNSYGDFGQLDEKAINFYGQIQDMPKPVKLSFNAEENRRFLLTMYLVLHSIKCEILLPYMDQYGKKLEWQTLKVKFESMNPDSLKQAIHSAQR